MAKFYRKFLRKQIDLASLGVEQRGDSVTYFCTPKGASVIGWAGVDGIHYCFIRGFGEMVFAVSPENSAPDYVHPLAESFEDFLMLLLACGDAAALEQAWMWDKEQFERFLYENPVTEEQQAVLTEIKEKLNLKPMENPWQYIKSLQDSFDAGKIRYTEDLNDPDMNRNASPEILEWKVYFEGNFWGHSGRDHAGKEIPIGTSFQWAGRKWLIPSIYSCSRGLVADFCMQADPEDSRAFMEKWGLDPEDGAGRQFSDEQRMEMDAENPMNFRFTAGIVLNGKELRYAHGCGISYHPPVSGVETNGPEARLVMDHYGLDSTYGWMIWRFSFPWKGRRRQEIKSLSMIMKQTPVPVPGPHFCVTAPGDSFDFICPETGERHRLTVQEYERQEIPREHVSVASDMEFPAHCMVMSYTIAPELSNHALTIADCMDSDRPRRKKQMPLTPVSTADVFAIGIIGGADGPTVITVGGRERGNLCSACSALHFEPVQDVEWRMVFHEKRYEDMVVPVLLDEKGAGMDS